MPLCAAHIVSMPLCAAHSVSVPLCAASSGGMPRAVHSVNMPCRLCGGAVLWQHSCRQDRHFGGRRSSLRGRGSCHYSSAVGKAAIRRTAPTPSGGRTRGRQRRDPRRCHGQRHMAARPLVISGRPPCSRRVSALEVPTQRGGRGDSGDTARPDGLHQPPPTGCPRGEGVWVRGTGIRVHQRRGAGLRPSRPGVRSCLALAAQFWGRPVLSGSLSGTARGNERGDGATSSLDPPSRRP
jgi:hypothetical protein